ENRVALADLADLVVVGTVRPGRDLLRAVPNLDDDARGSGAFELRDIQARGQNFAPGLLDARLRPRRVFIDVAVDVSDGDFTDYINRRLALGVEPVCRERAQHDADKQGSNDGERVSHSRPPQMTPH